MGKTMQVSAILTATILVTGLIGISFSDDALAKKPADTKKVVIHVKDQSGKPVSGALCSTFIGFNFDFVAGNKGGVVKLQVPADLDPVNIVCIDTIPLNANDVMFDIELKEKGTTVLQSTLNPVP
jgi:hypothetical protein